MNKDQFSRVHVILMKWRRHELTAQQAIQELSTPELEAEVLMILLNAAMINGKQPGDRR